MRIWLTSLIISQCDSAAVTQSYSARWVRGQNKCPWLFLEKSIITGVHMTLSLIYLFFIAVDLPEHFWCWKTLKRIIQYFSPPRQLDGSFFFPPFCCFTVLKAIQARHYFARDAIQVLLFLKGGSDCTSFQFSGISTQPAFSCAL